MAVRRAYRSADQWRSIINKQRKSGLTARAFCERNELGYASFNAWRRRLDIDCDPEPTSTDTFIELTPASLDSSTPVSALPQTDVLGQQSAPVTIELSLGSGMTLRIVRAG